jgi:hypothetical protein
LASVSVIGGTRIGDFRSEKLLFQEALTDFVVLAPIEIGRTPKINADAVRDNWLKLCGEESSRFRIEVNLHGQYRLILATHFRGLRNRAAPA